MGMGLRPTLLLLLHVGLAAGHKHQANPIRKVVTMLQVMSKKVEMEGKTEQKMFDEFICSCKTNIASLTKGIQDAETKIPQLESSIKELGAAQSSLKGDITGAKADMAEAKEAVGEATSLRERDAATFATESDEMKANLDAMGKAIAALKKGMGGSFLQSRSAKTLRGLAVSLDALSASDRDVLSGFLSTGQLTQGGNSGKGSEIVGILKQMEETMTGDLADAEAKEAAGIKGFDEMSKAKEEQVKALTRMVEEKTARLGEVGVGLVNMKADLDEASTGLVEDKEFLSTTETECATRKKEHELNAKSLQEELLAISETIKFLNDDDAQGLFKETLAGDEGGGASFLQTKMQGPNERQRAAAKLLREAARRTHSARLGLAAVQMRSQKGMDKIITMIRDMVTLLKKEQGDDDSKKAYCNSQLDEAEDKLKEGQLNVADTKKAISEAKEKAATIQSDVDALRTAIQDLDKNVESGGAQRKEEHDTFVDTLSSNNAAKEILGVAKNRMLKFYNPKLYKPEGGALIQQDSVVGAMGGDDADAAVQEEQRDTTADNSAPAVDDANVDDSAAVTFIQYSKQSDGSSKVVYMMDTLIQDLELQIQQMKMEEEQAQKDYEVMVEDSKKMRKLNSEAITEKEGFKSVLEEKVHKMKTHAKGFEKEVADVMELLDDLHQECDWLLNAYDVRKQARSDEIEALKKADSVLHGAKFD